jgi:hypothetical protein
MTGLCWSPWFVLALPLSVVDWTTPNTAMAVLTENQVFSLCNSIAMCFEVKYGMGRHIENVGMEEGLEQLKVRHSMPAPPFFRSQPSDKR